MTIKVQDMHAKTQEMTIKVESEHTKSQDYGTKTQYYYASFG